MLHEPSQVPAGGGPFQLATSSSRLLQAAWHTLPHQIDSRQPQGPLAVRVVYFRDSERRTDPISEDELDWRIVLP